MLLVRVMSSLRVFTLFCVLFISGCDPELPVSEISSDGSLSDIDNDGIADVSDAFPLDGSETLDTDNDGTGNNTDTDLDGKTAKPL